jgi:hypothetical protein
MTPTPVWIAERRVVLVHPNGRRVRGHIAVGQPYALAGADPTGRYESHCPIEIDSLHSSKHPIIGGGTLQALERGGRVLDPEDDSDVPLKSLFGPLLRELTSG